MNKTICPLFCRYSPITVLGLNLLFVAAVSLQPPLPRNLLATPINSATDPLLAGSTLIDFSSTTLGTYSSLTIGNVTFSGNGSLRVANTYSGQYNTTGNYLDNNAGLTIPMTIQFATPVSALGFNFGATDSDWTLNVYNSLQLLTGIRFACATFLGSDAGQYYGGWGILGAAASSGATLTGGTGDWVLLDNFSSGGTPVPDGGSTLALLGLALGGIAAAVKCKKKVA